MNYLILTALAIPAALTLIDFLTDEKKKPVKIVFTILTFIGLGFAYYVTSDDDAKIDELKTSAEKQAESSAKVKALLTDANDKLSDQSDSLSEGFQKLSNQLANESGGNLVILDQVKSLQSQVTNFANNVSDFNNEAMDILKSVKQADKIGKTHEDSTLPSTGFIRIPIGDKTGRNIDTKNIFAVLDDRHDKKGSLLIQIEGHQYWKTPGGKIGFKNDQEKKSYLVYKGVENNNYVFYVHLP